jgi:hypothetical protein
LSNAPNDGQHQFAGRHSGIYAEVQYLEIRAFFTETIHNVVQVPCGARQAVKIGQYQCVTLPDKIQRHGQFIAGTDRRDLLLVDLLATDGL